MNDLHDRITDEVGRTVIGAGPLLEPILAALVLGGHVLLEGPPGTAKTLLAASSARALDVPFRRIQFTPDMLPSDVTGNVALESGRFVFRPGPIFASVVLADEINRTPPKTQAALLEAMEEGAVTVDGERHELPRPFIVLATQNPIEYEGTYQLPEAQLDRFLFRVRIGYPDESSERAMLDLPRDGLRPAGLGDVRPVAAAADIAAARRQTEAITATAEVRDYVVAIVRQTRAMPTVTLGASPRAAVHLLAAAKAVAALAGRDYVTPDDVLRVSVATLAHRIVLAPDAALERVSTEDTIRAAVAVVPVPR